MASKGAGSSGNVGPDWREQGQERKESSLTWIRGLQANVFCYTDSLRGSVRLRGHPQGHCSLNVSFALSGERLVSVGAEGTCGWPVPLAHLAEWQPHGGQLVGPTSSDGRLKPVSNMKMQCVCIYVCVCAHVCAYVRVCTHVCICECVRTCMHVCTHVCACVCTCMCACACACVHAHAHVCAYMCVCMCVRVLVELMTTPISTSGLCQSFFPLSTRSPF